jgi:hypothetical protein
LDKELAAILQTKPVKALSLDVNGATLPKKINAPSIINSDPNAVSKPSLMVATMPEDIQTETVRSLLMVKETLEVKPMELEAGALSEALWIKNTFLKEKAPSAIDILALLTKKLNSSQKLVVKLSAPPQTKSFRSVASTLEQLPALTQSLSAKITTHPALIPAVLRDIA